MPAPRVSARRRHQRRQWYTNYLSRSHYHLSPIPSPMSPSRSAPFTRYCFPFPFTFSTSTLYRLCSDVLPAARGAARQARAEEALRQDPRRRLRNLRDCISFCPSLCLESASFRLMCTQEMINLHMGQGLDIWWHNGKKEPNVQEYLQARDLTHSRISKKKKTYTNAQPTSAQMCAYKTGTLARLSSKMSALIVGGTPLQVPPLLLSLCVCVFLSNL